MARSCQHEILQVQVWFLTLLQKLLALESLSPGSMGEMVLHWAGIDMVAITLWLQAP